jgi:hypothetical protein
VSRRRGAPLVGPGPRRRGSLFSVRQTRGARGERGLRGVPHDALSPGRCNQPPTGDTERSAVLEASTAVGKHLWGETPFGYHGLGCQWISLWLLER